MVLISLALSLGDSSDWGHWRECLHRDGQHYFPVVPLKVKPEESKT